MLAWSEELGYVEQSPAAAIKPKRLIGQDRPIRTRVLDDRELLALWKATDDDLGYPWSPLYRLMLLTGVRLREASDAQWREIDFDKRVWRIPASRFKANAEHHVPLNEDVIALLKSLPHFSNGDYIFTTTGGARPVSGFSKSKKTIDAKMKKKLGELVAWRTHDIRRVVRSRLSALKVPDHVAEMCLGHGRRGLQRIYDQHGYESEIREALAAWADRLRDLVNPPDPSGKVVKLQRKAARK
jgi:integrase